MSVNFCVRDMKPIDIAKIKEIIDLSFSRFMGLFAYLSVRDKEGETIVAETQGTVVGFTKLIDFKIAGIKYGCVLWIAVHPSFRRKGFADALTTEGIKRLKLAGSKCLFASVQRRKIGPQIVLTQNGFRRARFLELWHLFGSRVLQFYGDIWLAPGEVVLIRSSES